MLPLSIPRDAHRVRSLPRLSAPSSLRRCMRCSRSAAAAPPERAIIFAAPLRSACSPAAASTLLQSALTVLHAAARAQQRLLEQLKDITDGIASNSLSLEQLETLRMLGGQDGLTRAVDKCVASAKLRRRCLL